MNIDIKSESAIIQAVFDGDLDEIILLITSKKADVNHQSSNTRIAPLHIASYCSGSYFKTSQSAQTNENKDDDKENQEENTVVDAHKNYIDIINYLCEKGARVNCKDGKSLTPLHYACRTNSHNAVKILLSHQADVNTRDKNWQAPLHICAMYNSVECAKLLIQHMSNVDLTDRQGRSALAHASFNGHIEMAKLLLENGANANIHDKQERKPIHWASYVGYLDIVKLLVNHGADVNSLDKELYTPLLVACASGKSEEIISLLIEMGADTSATTVHDSSIFHLACLNGHDQIVKLLLNNYDLKIKTNSKGYHPIHYAAGCKLGAFCLELLVSLDVDVNISSFFDGRTPMHVAAMHGRTSCAQILFSNGSQIDVKDSDGNTPLHLAASYGQTSMIKFLIDCGSNIYICGSDGMLPWAMAALYGHSECFRVLDIIIPAISARKQYFEMKDDHGRTFMHLAAISGNYECLNILINSDCDVNQVDKNGNTPLHYACAGTFLKCVELLINSGAEVNETNTCISGEFNDNINDCFAGGCGCTPLMLACAFDQDGYVVRELVLNARARSDIVDKNGYNTLHYAALQGNRNVFEIILNNCKNLNQQQNKPMVSPLHILAYLGHRESLEFLIRNDFEIEIKDKNGRTPLDLACYQGETSCVECLMNYGAIYDTRDSINQRTPVHAAAYNNNTECLKILASITSDNDLNTDLTLETCYLNKTLSNLRDKHDRTALHVAVEQGHLNTIQFLLNQMGSDPLAFDNKKRTALHRAAALGYEEICLTILKSNQETAYQRDTHGLLPIHYAVMAGHSNLISLLFEYHESMNVEEVTSKKITKKDRLVDRQGFSLLHLACFSGHLASVETICELGQTYPYLIEMLTNNSISIYNKFSPIHFACHNSHDTCLSYLFDRYNDKLSELIELEDSSGNRPLHICAITNECDCASLLLDSNCTIDSKNKKLLTPFMLAVCHNSFSMMELLLSNSNKVDLNNIDTNGNSSLHLACINRHENCALFILDHIESNSPLVNLKNTDGETALHLASSNGWLTCVEILLSKGADIWIKNKSQKTPLLSCAKNDAVSDCLELMLSRLLMTAQTPMKHHHKLNSNYPISNPSSTTKNMMMIMMMSNAAAAAAASQHQTPINNNKNATYNLNSINKHLNDSLCLLANSDIILNDVHMNQLSDSMDENHNSKIDDIKKDLTDNIMNSTTKNNNDIMMNSNNNNLNSTLILNDGDNGGNGSGGGSGAAGCGSVGSGLGSIENLDTLNGCYLNLNTSNDFLKQQSSFDFDLIESANMKLNSYSSNNNVNNNSNHNNDNNHNQNDPNSKILQSNSVSSFDSEFY